MKRTPLISLITVNFNTLKDTVEFLESVRHLSYPHIETIVVDNFSKESPGPMLTKKFPNIIFIQSSKNLGFAGGNNLGIQAAKGDYLFFLNSDTIVSPDFLQPLIEFMESNQKVGMASPKVLFADNKTIQYAGAVAINPYTGRGKRVGLGEEDKRQYDTCYPTGLGHGAALLVRREVIIQVGLMPEIFFLYYEEHDWCEQAKRKGFEMYYLGIASIIHKEGMSTGGDESPLKIYYMSRNRLLFHRRNSKGFPFLIGLLFFSLIAVPKTTAKYLLGGKVQQIKAFYRGIGWNLVNWRLL
ncbi:glycosyltransferase family 2 protein [soil metagenome]